MKEHVWIKRVLYVTLAVIAIATVLSLNFYKRVYAPNFFTPDREDYLLFLHRGATYDEVVNRLDSLGLLKNTESFKWVAEKKNYPNHVYSGRYRIRHRSSNNELINMLRSGAQEPVQITFNNIRTLEQFSVRIAGQLEMSAKELMVLLKDGDVQKKYGFDEHTIKCMFIPNTYELYWNISAANFLDRMFAEYENFWKGRRDRKAEQINMSRTEVITLASIVDEETSKDKEKARIAGLYMNRLNKPMRLQADPTVIYAVGDFSIKRVLRKHYQLDSPYNTYRIDGLPPGPICIPAISSIDAVLNFEEHNYLYMCAKADFSGYHEFATTLSEHNRNAAKYRRELNKRKIYR